MTLRVFAAIVLTASAIAGAAQSETATAENSKDMSVEAALKRHNIALTQPALLEALRHPDVGVRKLALTELIEQKTTGAIPGIQEAFAAENIPEMRMYLAYALSEMGDASATEWLKRSCRDGNLSIDQRLETRISIPLSRTDSCLEPMFDALDSGNEDAATRTWAMSLLIGDPNLSETDLQRSFILFLHGLASSDASERAEASFALAAFGMIEGIPYLEQAIFQEEQAQEKQEGVLTQMQTDLRKLKGQQS